MKRLIMSLTGAAKCAPIPRQSLLALHRCQPIYVLSLENSALTDLRGIRSKIARTQRARILAG